MDELRRNGPLPLYYQIEVAIRRAIESGTLPGGRLPPEEELAERYAVSRQTVRTALRRLEEDGLIVRRRAHGTFVRADAAAKLQRHLDHLLGFEADLRRQGAELAVEVLAVERIEPPAEIGAALALAEAPAVRVRRLGRVDGAPLWLESRFYPPEIGERMAEQDLTTGSITNLLERVLGTRVVAGRIRVEAAAATARQARHLEVHSGHPLLVSQFTFYGPEGRALEVVRAAFRADRYAFSFELPSRSGDAVPLGQPGRLSPGPPGQPCPTGEREAPRTRDRPGWSASLADPAGFPGHDGVRLTGQLRPQATSAREAQEE